MPSQWVTKPTFPGFYWIRIKKTPMASLGVVRVEVRDRELQVPQNAGYVKLDNSSYWESAEFMLIREQPGIYVAGDSEYDRAYNIAVQAHAGQFRRDGITPYVTHPIAVSERVSERAKPAALLHGVLEDTELTLEQISALFSPETVVAVDLLTKLPNSVESYLDYISRVKQDPIAREVKIQDIKHNLMSSPKPKAVAKYQAALSILEGE